MLHQAIASQAAWQARPLQDDARVRVERVESTPRQRTRKGGFMDAQYSAHFEEWTRYAEEAPRSMKELAAEMKRLCGKEPANSTVYFWCEHKKVEIRVDRKYSGVYKIGAELLRLSNEGYSTSALIDFAESRGYKLEPSQMRGTISHARRRGLR